MLEKIVIGTNRAVEIIAVILGITLVVVNVLKLL